MSRWSVALVCLLSVGLIGGLVATRTLRGDNPAPAAVPKELTSYRNIVKRVLPAVVSIESRVKQPRVRNMNQPRNRRNPRFDDSQVPEEFRRFFQEFQVPFGEMPEQPSPTVGFGSGFLVDPKGVILTNFHVVGGATEVEVTLADGRKFVSRDIKGDRKTDLAIVRIQSKDSLPYLEVGDSDAMEIGDRVLAVGAPFGLTGTVTHGIVSGKGRNGFHMNMYEDFIQTDAAINPGNSGGPLVNLEGQVIGINSAIKSRTGGFQGVGLAISANLAKNVMKQLETSGVVHRGYLGVQVKMIDAEVAERLGVPEKHGVLVAEVFDDSPAAKAGVKAGDVITSVGGKAIKNAQELQHMVATLPLNKATPVTLFRDGKEMNKDVTIREQPENFGLAANNASPRPRAGGDGDAVKMDKIGVEVTDLTPERAEQLGYGSKVNGALITHVDADSPAGDAGLRRGMVITKVDKKAVADAEAFRNVIDKSDLNKDILLQVQSPRGGTDYVILKAQEASSKK